MRILNAIYRLEKQRNRLGRGSEWRAAVTPSILGATFLALLTACTIEFKPDKAPGGVTGASRPMPANPGPPPPIYPDAVYPYPVPSTDGGYGLGNSAVGNPTVGNPTVNRPTSDGFSIKITSL